MKEQSALRGDGPVTVPLFVYGTLRPGGALHDRWIGGAVVDSEPATVVGYSLFSMGNAFPLMVREPGHVVYGDILWVDKTHPAFGNTVGMELHTGYDMEMVEAEGDMTIPVLAFIWNRSVGGLKRVPENDWNAS